MRYSMLGCGVTALLLMSLNGSAGAVETLTINQDSAQNHVRVIQERNLFHTTNRTLTATTGRTTVTEVVAIGPDPQPVSISQVGTRNRALIYQYGTMPNIDVRQSGAVNVVRTLQRAMP